MSERRTPRSGLSGQIRERVSAAVPRRIHPGAHPKVFALGIGAAIAVGSTMVGLTWAGSDDPQQPIVKSSPVPSTVPGTCTIGVVGRPITMDVDRARTMTMVAAVATQIDAVPVQVARAMDVAVTGKSHYLPTVDQTLRLLAKEDTTAPSAESLAVFEALSRPGTVTCHFKAARTKVEKKDKNGLTPRASKVRTGVLDAFGTLRTTGFGKSADSDDAAQKSGRAVEVWPKNGKKVDRATGWVLANWLVARGSTYRLSVVTFDSWTWRAATGWSEQPAPAPIDPNADAAAVKAAKKAAAQAEAARQSDSVLAVVEKGR